MSSRKSLLIVCCPADPSYGGPASFLQTEMKYLKKEFRCTLVCTHASAIERETVSKLYSDIKLYSSRLIGRNRWFFSLGSIRALIKEVGTSDIVYLHMIWDAPILVAGILCRLKGVPYCIVPHGSLATAERLDSLHKRVYWHIFRPIMKRASFIHALTDQEQEGIKLLCPGANIVVLPNMSRRVLPAVTEDIIYERWKAATYVYLGRISATKNLANLLYAWKKVFSDRKDLHMVLVGPDYRGYKEEIRRLIKELGIGESVDLIDLVEGPRKEKLLKRSTYFVHPSYIEGQSTSLIEAASFGIPLIHCQSDTQPYLSDSTMSFTSEPTVGGIAKQLIASSELLSIKTKLDKYAVMSKRAREIFEVHHDSDIVMSRMISLMRYYSRV